MEKKTLTKNTRKRKKKIYRSRSFHRTTIEALLLSRGINYSSRMSTTSSDNTDDAPSTTFIKVAFDSSSRPFSLNNGSLITAESRREYLSLPSVVRWHQSTSDVEIHVRLPRGASEKKGDVSVRVTSTSVRVRLNGHDWGTKGEPLAGTLFRGIKTDESSWTIVRRHVERARTNRSPLFSLFTTHR